MAKQKQRTARKESQALVEAAPEAAAKSLDEYEQAKPLQLSLFELLSPDEKKFSNTIELYDFMPKYHWGKVERIGGEF